MKDKASSLDNLMNGLVKSNPIFVQLIGMCPTLAITTSLKNAIGMGIALTFVLLFSNVVISLLRNFISSKIKIVAYIVIISGFVTVVDMTMKAYFVSLYQSLGIFIPLIVVNCLILARAESYASKNKVLPSAIDAIGMGAGFTVGLIVISFFRELFGNGTLWGYHILGSGFKPALMLILPPGAFLVLGVIIAGIQWYHLRKGAK
jgi:electron transport complex protein RnfE